MVGDYYFVPRFAGHCGRNGARRCGGMSPPKCRWHFPRVARIVGDIPPHDPPASAAHLSDTSGRKMELLKGGNPRTGSRVRAPPIPLHSMGGRGGFLPAFLPHLPSGKNLLLSSCNAGQRGRIYGTKLAFVILKRLFALRVANLKLFSAGRTILGHALQTFGVS